MTERNKKIRGDEYQRTIDLDFRLADTEARTIPASLSSEAPYERWFGREVLVHDDKAIDMARASKNGLPLLWNHDSSEPIGRVHNVRLLDGRLIGDLKFGRNPKAEQVWNDVRDGVLDSMSIGYRIGKWEEEDGSDLVRVTKWSVYEASVVSVPADHSVGINRSNDEEKAMSNNDGQQAETRGGQPAADARRDLKIAENAGRNAGANEERLRVRTIDSVFTETDDMGERLVPDTDMMRAIRVRAIDEGWDELRTRREIMAANPYEQIAIPEVGRTVDAGAVRSHAAKPTAAHRGGMPSAEIKADALDKFADAVTATLLVKSGVDASDENAKAMRESGFGDFNMVRLAGEYLHLTGRGDMARRSDKEIAREVLRRDAGPHTHSDFSTGILANVANKSVLKGWDESGATWGAWANIGSLPDFKPATIAGLGGYPDLDQIPRSGGPYRHKSMDDQYETAQLATYGALFGISREAIENDDMNEFTRVPMKMGIAAARKVNGLVYAVLTGNQTMTYDSTALFHADHANAVTSSGAAPSVSTLDTAFAAMRKQKAPLPTGETGAAAYLNLRPSYLIVPAALEGTGWTILNSMYDPAGTTASKSTRDAPNRFNRSMELVVDATLDGSSTTAWYLAASKAAAVDTVTVFFLNGNSMPYIEQADNEITSDGRTFKVRIDAVARALDHRGMYYNVGT